MVAAFAARTIPQEATKAAAKMVAREQHGQVQEVEATDGCHGRCASDSGAAVQHRRSKADWRSSSAKAARGPGGASGDGAKSWACGQMQSFL